VPNKPLQKDTYCKCRTSSYTMSLTPNCGTSSHRVLLPLMNNPVLENMNALAPKTRAQRILDKSRNDFDWISVSDGGHFPKQNWIGGTFPKITVRTLQAQTWDAAFVETRFTGPADLTAVRYSVTSNGLSDTRQFRFQGNVIEIGRIWNLMCNVIPQVTFLFRNVTNFNLILK
jgi:hypothetical protein